MQELVVEFSALKSTILNAARPDGMTTAIVAIDGCGGSGKSTFAARLARILSCPIVHTDDFAAWDNPLGWHPRMIKQVLDPLRDNTVARYQRYDWETRKLAEWHELAPQNIVILEGVSSTRKEFRDYLAYRIYVETDRDTRLQRGLERDGPEAAELWRSWMIEEDAYLQRDNPIDEADIVIVGNPTTQTIANSFVAYQR